MRAKAHGIEAALTVFAKLPLPQISELRNHHPRIAGITSEKWPAILPVFKENLRRFLAGEPLRNVVDEELAY